MKKGQNYNTLVYLSIIVLLLLAILLIYYYFSGERGVEPPIITEDSQTGSGQVAIIIEPNAINTNQDQPNDAVMEEATANG